MPRQLDQSGRAKHHHPDPRKHAQGGRHQIGTPAGFRSESMAGFLLECMAGFVGIRSLWPYSTSRPPLTASNRSHESSAAVAIGRRRRRIKEWDTLASTVVPRSIQGGYCCASSNRDLSQSLWSLRPCARFRKPPTVGFQKRVVNSGGMKSNRRLLAILRHLKSVEPSQSLTTMSSLESSRAAAILAASPRSIPSRIAGSDGSRRLLWAFFERVARVRSSWPKSLLGRFSCLSFYCTCYSSFASFSRVGGMIG
jgi:hypothetical protein